MRVDYQRLQEESYRIAEEHGWHNDGRDFHDYIALMHCELSEAVEAFRVDQDFTKVYYVNGKPEGVPIELADLLIRIADTTKQLGRDLAEDIKASEYWTEFRGDCMGPRLIKMINYAHKLTCQLQSEQESRRHSQVPRMFGDICLYVVQWCEANGVDIEAAVEIKHKYNETRPYRHGGKAI